MEVISKTVSFETSPTDVMKALVLDKMLLLVLLHNMCKYIIYSDTLLQLAKIRFTHIRTKVVFKPLDSSWTIQTPEWTAAE